VNLNETYQLTQCTPRAVSIAPQKGTAPKVVLRLRSYTGAMIHCAKHQPNVFTRYEKKYLIDRRTSDRIQEQLAEFMARDEHNRAGSRYTISTIYYDTSDSELIRRSLSKPFYKEKLRLRAYGCPTIDSRVFLEIKKKLDGRVNKRRIALPLHDAYEFVATGERPPSVRAGGLQVSKEIEYFLQRHDVVPAVCLTYDRHAFVGMTDGGLRITFDSDLRARRNDLRLEFGGYGSPLLADGTIVMEVKTPTSVPVWLAELLSHEKVFSRSFSKYGTEYLHLLSSIIEHKEKMYA
jgi:hypothetical protein